MKNFTNHSSTCSAIVFAAPDASRGRMGTLNANAMALHIALVDNSYYELPWTTLNFSLGGFDKDQLVINGIYNDDTVYLQMSFTAIAKIAQDIPEHIYQHQILSLQPLAKRRENWAKSFIWFIFSTSIAGVLALYFSWGIVLDFAVTQIPVSWEVYLGKVAAKDILIGSSVINSGTDFDNLQNIWKLLINENIGEGFEYDLHLVSKTEPNAFALPGGSVIVYTGLLKESQSAEEIAGVLAHEIQHIRNRHGLRRIVGNLGIMATIAIFLGDLRGIFGIVREAVVHLGTSAYSRHQEQEADNGAVQLLVKLKIDPLPLSNFFERLGIQQGKMEQTIRYFSSHPESKKRAESIRNLRYNLAKDVQFKPLKIRI